MASQMGIRRRIPALTSLLLGVLAVSACAAPASTPPRVDPSASPPLAGAASLPPPTSPITLIDDVGREVTLDAAAERVVSLAPSNTEIVCALDACDTLVGVTDFDDYPPQVADVTEVVIQTQVDLERLVAAEPDLVLAAGNELTPSAAIEQIVDLGIPVLVLYPESLEEVYADIALVAQAVGREDEAATLVDELRGRVTEIEAALDGVARPRTLYEVFHAQGTTYTAGEGSFLASLLEIAGSEPVTGDAEGVLDPEDLVAADPELVLLGAASYDPALATPGAALEALRARPGWADLTAVREGNVVPYVDDIVTTRPGPRIVDGLEALARAIHPDRFD